MNGITVCVEYGDLLRITLPTNLKHFDKFLVVTTPGDKETQAICEKYGVGCFQTNAFYQDGAEFFRKWLALEEGLDVLGRDGWMWVIDADIVLPSSAPLPLERGKLYTPRRRMLYEPQFYQTEYAVPSSWRKLRLSMETEFAGYSQIFHANDPVLASRPWYEPAWKHAGGGDSFFQRRWPDKDKVRPDFEVLHLGRDGQNWCGRVTERIDGVEVEEAQERKERLEEFMRKRKATRSFSNEKV